MQKIPVKMLVNASSTLVESNADVSINAKLFLSLQFTQTINYIQYAAYVYIYGIIDSYFVRQSDE